MYKIVLSHANDNHKPLNLLIKSIALKTLILSAVIYIFLCI